MAEKLLPVPEPIKTTETLPGTTLERERWTVELSVLLRYLSILAVTAINKIREEKK